MKISLLSLLNTKELEMSIGTFHSICARLIRVEAKNIGLDPHFVIYDVQDQLDLYKVVLKELNISKDLINVSALLKRHLEIPSNNDIQCSETWGA